MVILLQTDSRPARFLQIRDTHVFVHYQVFSVSKSDPSISNLKTGIRMQDFWGSRVVVLRKWLTRNQQFRDSTTDQAPRHSSALGNEEICLAIPRYCWLVAPTAPVVSELGVGKIEMPPTKDEDEEKLWRTGWWLDMMTVEVLTHTSADPRFESFDESSPPVNGPGASIWGTPLRQPLRSPTATVAESGGQRVTPLRLAMEPRNGLLSEGKVPIRPASPIVVDDISI
ncbi:hypothetical protein V8F20_003825 [Naviculisporaceae sp. PSN 640]